ncbi:MAG: S41 family peptidase [Flavobacteriaceae bacterium]|nr:S41 family peptidase [Flavobacteriaceae bacterium]
MNSKNKVYIPLFLALAVALGIFIGSTLNYPKKNTVMLFNRNPQEAKIKKLIDYIQYDYVDKIDTDSLLDGTIRQILGKLDPHSVYIPASDHDDITERMSGEFVGIGVQFRMHEDTIAVIKVIPDGPSDRAGLKAGDRILVAENDTLYGKQRRNNYVIKTLKGKPNTKVNIEVYRKSENAYLNFTIKRGSVPIKSVDAAYMVNDSLGYIKVNRFAATTYKEFKKALDELITQNMKGLILDLRGNQGGFLGVATQMVDEFLEDDKLIVFTKNKGGRVDKSYATKKGDFEQGKVYVLIDENSASASEIVAGALQDNDKGTIVGRRSFGKGLVQQEMELGDGSAVRLTVSRYYTPTGRSIQKPYNGADKNQYYNDDFHERYLNGELQNRDSIKVADSLKFTTPKGKTVYGGGGIIPDVFVPIDTTAYFGTFYFGLMNDFVFDYVDNNRKELEQMTFEDFLKDFDKDERILNQYLSIIKTQNKGVIADKTYIKHYLKSLFAQFLYDDNAFNRVLNQNDRVLQRVRELEHQVDYVKQ